MHSQARAIVAAVRRCIGTPFRPQGRTPGLALDCIGVALIGAAAAGARISAIPGYSLAGDGQSQLESALAADAFTRLTNTQLTPGDLLLFAPATGRRHLAVLVSGTPAPVIVHAHAGLRRVVEGPIEPAWQLLGAWRYPEKA